MSKDKEITSKPEISAKAAVTIGVAIGLGWKSFLAFCQEMPNYYNYYFDYGYNPRLARSMGSLDSSSREQTVSEFLKRNFRTIFLKALKSLGSEKFVATSRATFYC